MSDSVERVRRAIAGIGTGNVTVSDGFGDALNDGEPEWCDLADLRALLAERDALAVKLQAAEFRLATALTDLAERDALAQREIERKVALLDAMGPCAPEDEGLSAPEYIRKLKSDLAALRAECARLREENESLNMYANERDAELKAIYGAKRRKFPTPTEAPTNE